MAEQALPPGWSEIPLGQAAQWVNGRAFKKTEWESEGRPIIRIQNLNDPAAEFNRTTGEFEDRYFVEDGDLLFAWAASLGAYIWQGEPAWLNQHIFKVVPAPGVDKKFLFYFLKSVITDIYSRTQGSGMVHITKKEFSAIPLLLPPEGEQRRIVAKIEELFSELDDSVANLETARARLQAYRQSLLKHAFEGRLTEQWRRDHAEELESADQLLERIREERQARYQQQLEDWKAEVAQWEANGQPGKKPRKPKAPKMQVAPTEEELEDLPFVPPGWSWVRLGEAAEVAGGITKNPKRQELYNKRPFLRVGNVYANRLDLDEVHEIGVEENELPKVTLEAGDLLVVEGNGSVDQIGRVAVWDGRIPGTVHQNHLIRVRPTSLLNSFFALWFLLSKQGRDHIMRVASSTSGLHTLSLSKVENLLVPICPVQEQELVLEKLEAKLSEMEEAEKTIETSLQQTERLRQSILKQAFEGRLVPQNADDEPTAELLACLRGEVQGTDEETV